MVDGTCQIVHSARSWALLPENIEAHSPSLLRLLILRISESRMHMIYCWMDLCQILAVFLVRGSAV